MLQRVCRKVGVVTGGTLYQVNDKLVFEEQVADNFETVGKVSKVRGSLVLELFLLLTHN